MEKSSRFAFIEGSTQQGIFQEFVIGGVFGFVGGVYDNCASGASKKFFYTLP
jgi:hypothetical protein